MVRIISMALSGTRAVSSFFIGIGLWVSAPQGAIKINHNSITWRHKTEGRIRLRDFDSNHGNAELARGC